MTVKRPWIIILAVLFAGILAKCDLRTPSLTPTSEITKIKPGDRLGNFLITTGNRKEEIFVWQTHPIKGEKPNETYINIDCGKMFNPAIGVYGETHKDMFDSQWAELSYEMFIDDILVDLQAFGTIQSLHPVVGIMRHWNVAIVTDEPGKITIHEVGQLNNHTIDDWITYTVLPP
jgi:hypothetical protein